MAPGLKVGDRVKAQATCIFGCRRVGDIFGPWASRSEVHGTVVEVLGTGRTRKLRVKWDECNDVSVLSPRALQLHVNNHVVAMEDDSECSGSSSESDTIEGDIEQSGEEAHLAQENDETSLLRPHNTDWTLTEGIQVDHFQGPKTILGILVVLLVKEPRLTTFVSCFPCSRLLSG